MTNVVSPTLAVTYIRSTDEQAPATIIGRSIHGEGFIYLKYMRKGHELEHLPLLTVYSSQSAAHPHRHQRQVRGPWEHEGVHQHVVVPPGGARLERTSIPQLLMPPIGSKDLQNLLKFAYTLCVLVPCCDYYA